MCAVSMISDAWRNPQHPNYIPPTRYENDWEFANMMRDILRRPGDIDKMVGARDCKFTKAEKRVFEDKLADIVKNGLTK